MGDTYATVKEVSSAIKRQDRADVILELEASLMKYKPGVDMPTGPSFVVHTLLTIPMQYSDWQRYLHQLSPQEVRAGPHLFAAEERRGWLTQLRPRRRLEARRVTWRSRCSRCRAASPS